MPERKNTLILSVFKFAPFGGEEGIRTLVGLLPNGFQDRLVMTASIPLRIFCCINEIILVYEKLRRRLVMSCCGARNFLLGASALAKFRPLPLLALPVSAAGGGRARPRFDTSPNSLPIDILPQTTGVVKHDYSEFFNKLLA